MSKPKITALSLALLAIALFSGCQTSPTRPAGSSSSDEAIVMDRAVQRWNYLIEKKAEKAYAYLSPGYRKTMPQAQYVGEKTNTAMRWKHVSANKAKCEEDVCDVWVSVDYEVNLPNTGGKPITTFAPMQEKWVKAGGKWYYLPSN